MEFRRTEAAKLELVINPTGSVGGIPFVDGAVDGNVVVGSMTAEQILNEIKALPSAERQQLLKRVRQLESDEIPEDFVEALADFEQERFVPMETALHQVPPKQ